MALPESPETTTLRCSLLAGFLPTHEQKPSQRMRYGDRLLPLPMADFANLGEVASANPKNNLFRGYLFRPRPGQKGREFTERARANIIEGSDLLPQLLVSPHQNLCVSKSQFTNDFREKCDFLDVGFDQKQVQIRPEDLQGQARESAP